jgi:hypothetical protein
MHEQHARKEPAVNKQTEVRMPLVLWNGTAPHELSQLVA